MTGEAGPVYRVYTGNRGKRGITGLVAVHLRSTSTLFVGCRGERDLNGGGLSLIVYPHIVHGVLHALYVLRYFDVRCTYSAQTLDTADAAP